jgi:hypothetical protein
MNLQEIKQAIEQGKNVKWTNDNYNVIKDNKNQYLIICENNNHTIGLFWADEKTLNGKEEDFYIKN